LPRNTANPALVREKRGVDLSTNRDLSTP
jgi:hypothetical protein